MADTESPYMTVREAREALGVSKPKIAALIAAGTLPTVDDPLDKRHKLILRADVEKLAARSSSRGKRGGLS